MYRRIPLAAGLCAWLAFGLPAHAIEVEQENSAFTQGTDWEYISLTNTIVIKTPSSSETYVFWAHADNDPDTLAEIREITLDQNIDPGTVKLKVSKTEEGLTPGATTIGRITIEDSGITSILEGVSVTGDFLTVDSMTVDHVVGPILVGGSLKKTITVLNDLEGRIVLEGDLVSGADIVIGGDMTKSIILADLEGCIHVAGSLTTAAIVC